MIDREYYPLAVAAEVLGCSENDLIHLGARGRLDIYAIPSSFSVLTIIKSDEGKAELLNEPTQPLKIAIDTIRYLEAGNIEEPIEICKSGGFFYCDFFAEIFVNKEDDGIPWEDDYDDKIKMYAVTRWNRLRQTDVRWGNLIDFCAKIFVRKSYFNIWDVLRRVTLKECNLVILAVDVRILSELTSTKSIAEIGYSKTDETHTKISNQLEVLNKASVRFWSNAVLEEKDTWPNTTDIIDWLRNNNYSESLAKKAASIIRPEWAGAGRKPEE
ncbi:MAG: hypothetical protein CTY13_03945 [Methylobacter sp.]|nr:MAG: hypothetical protein CTY13_03945 [Methylobacter sp.]